jgi:hypothetical protein
MGSSVSAELFLDTVPSPRLLVLGLVYRLVDKKIPGSRNFFNFKVQMSNFQLNLNDSMPKILIAGTISLLGIR